MDIEKDMWGVWGKWGFKGVPDHKNSIHLWCLPVEEL